MRLDCEVATKRTVGTVLVGICEICFGLFFLLMALMMVRITFGAAPLPSTSIAQAKELFVALGAM